MINNLEEGLAAAWKLSLNSRRIPTAEEIYSLRHAKKCAKFIDEIFRATVIKELYRPQRLNGMIQWYNQRINLYGGELSTELQMSAMNTSKRENRHVFDEYLEKSFVSCHIGRCNFLQYLPFSHNSHPRTTRNDIPYLSEHRC